MLLTAAVFSIGCKCADTERGEHAVYTLVYGGDVLLGNEMNEVAHSPKQLSNLFGDTASIFKRADIAFLNAEGVIAKGGRPVNKGERNPWFFRTHPRILDAFKKVGIDIVSVGNNHVGDYGRGAFIEMLDRLSAANIKYTGGGYNAADAERPTYLLVDDIVVAIVAANMNYSPSYRATRNTPGTLHFEGFDETIPESTVEKLRKILKRARRHAHLVFFSPHWGKGWQKETMPSIREFAEKLIEAGYDGILGHSAHRFHGAEVMAGKPVLYDAGNLAIFWTDDRDASSRGLVFELRFTRNGVQEVRAYPVRLKKNSINFAKGKIKNTMMDQFEMLSADLGTEVVRHKKMISIPCRPSIDRKMPQLTPPPMRPARSAIREAPSYHFVSSVPDDATPLQVRYANGIQLLGVRVVPDIIPEKKNNALVSLYFTTEKTIRDSITIRLEVHGTNRHGKNIVKTYNHIPGDWLFPTNEWPVGKIIQDTVYIRLSTRGPDEISFFAGLEGHRPISFDTAYDDDELIHIETRQYDDKGPGVIDFLRRRDGKR